MAITQRSGGGYVNGAATDWVDLFEFYRAFTRQWKARSVGGASVPLASVPLEFRWLV